MMNKKVAHSTFEQLSEKIRNSCIQAAREGFREASMSGLCSEGAMEAAIGAIQSINLDEIVADFLENSRK
ncbi:MAG: acetyltransferase [Balneolaceae bacterium]|jgi:hypothetical protein